MYHRMLLYGFGTRSFHWSDSMMRRTPMKRGTKPLKAKKQWKPRYKPQSKRQDREYALACYGEPCYLRVDRICDHFDVVPCHSNQQQHGKGMGIKANDLFTVPGCRACHYCIDQGNYMTKAQRQETWDNAYKRWEPRRAEKMGLQDEGVKGGLEQAPHQE